MKYLIYTRVSPKGSNWVGSETTVVDQAAQCKAYIFATDPQGEVLDTVTDEFESGCSSKRPGWQTILSDLEHDRSEWDVLVVRHLDRFSRSLTDALQALEIIHEKASEHASAIAAIAGEYRKLFNQDSVAITVTELTFVQA